MLEFGSYLEELGEPKVPTLWNDSTATLAILRTKTTPSWRNKHLSRPSYSSSPHSTRASRSSMTTPRWVRHLHSFLLQARGRVARNAHFIHCFDFSGLELHCGAANLCNPFKSSTGSTLKRSRMWFSRRLLNQALSMRIVQVQLHPAACPSDAWTSSWNPGCFIFPGSHIHQVDNGVMQTVWQCLLMLAETHAYAHLIARKFHHYGTLLRAMCLKRHFLPAREVVQSMALLIPSNSDGKNFCMAVCHVNLLVDLQHVGAISLLLACGWPAAIICRLVAVMRTSRCGDDCSGVRTFNCLFGFIGDMHFALWRIVMNSQTVQSHLDVLAVRSEMYTAICDSIQNHRSSVAGREEYGDEFEKPSDSSDAPAREAISSVSGVSHKESKSEAQRSSTKAFTCTASLHTQLVITLYSCDPPH
eukprot:5335552-Amphidinium_carterae.1